MVIKKWDILNTEKVINHKWLDIEKHQVKISEDTVIDDFFIIKRKNYVAIIAEDKEDILFLKQYRHGIGDICMNLPMGFLDENETPEQAGKRELLEETGYEAESVKCLGEFYLAPSNMPTKSFVIHAKNIKQKLANFIDEKEGELELIRIPKKDINALILNGELKDISSIFALMVFNSNIEKF